MPHPELALEQRHYNIYLYFILHICHCNIHYYSIRLSSIGDPYGHLNPKWVAGDPKLASNRVPIREIFFGCLRGTIKYGYPLSWKHICRKNSLLDLVVEEDAEYVLNLLPITLPKKTNESYILGIIVGDSLTMTIYLKSRVVLELTEATSRCSM